jgi:hypothetical protein
MTSPDPQKKKNISYRSPSPSPFAPISIQRFPLCVMSRFVAIPSPGFSSPTNNLDGYVFESQNNWSLPALSKNRSVLARDDPDTPRVSGVASAFHHSSPYDSGFHHSGSGNVSRHLSRHSDDLDTRSHISISSDGPDTNDSPEVIYLRRENTCTNLKIECAMLRGQITGVKYVSISSLISSINY